MTHEHPEGVVDGTNADVAADSYHKYKEDVAMLKNCNVNILNYLPFTMKYSIFV